MFTPSILSILCKPCTSVHGLNLCIHPKKRQRPRNPLKYDLFPWGWRSLHRFSTLQQTHRNDRPDFTSMRTNSAVNLKSSAVSHLPSSDSIMVESLARLNLSIPKGWICEGDAVKQILRDRKMISIISFLSKFLNMSDCTACTADQDTDNIVTIYIQTRKEGPRICCTHLKRLKESPNCFLSCAKFRKVVRDWFELVSE